MYGGMYVHEPSDGSRFTLSSAIVTNHMARKKISTTIYITPEQDERLKLLHERTKVPVAVYIREGIDLVLEKHEGELPGQLQLAVGAGSKK